MTAIHQGGRKGNLRWTQPTAPAAEAEALGTRRSWHDLGGPSDGLDSGDQLNGRRPLPPPIGVSAWRTAA